MAFGTPRQQAEIERLTIMWTYTIADLRLHVAYGDASIVSPEAQAAGYEEYILSGVRYGNGEMN